MPHLNRLFTFDGALVNAIQSIHLNHLAVSPEGNSIIVVLDHWLQRFSLSGFPAQIRDFEEPIQAVYINCMAVDRDSGLLAIGGHDSSGSPPIKVFDLRSAKPVWVMSNLKLGFLDRMYRDGEAGLRARYECRIVDSPVRFVTCIDISSRQNLVVATTSDTLGKNDSLTTGVKAYSISGDLLGVRGDISPTCLKLLPHGKCLAATVGRTLSILDSQTLATIRSAEICEAEIDRIAIGGERSMVALSAGGEVVCVDDRLQPRWSSVLSSTPRCVAFEPHGEMVYLGTSLGDLMVLDRNGKVTESIQIGESVRGIDFLHDGAHVLVGCKNRDLHVFETPGSLPAGAAHDVATWVERLRNTPSSSETSTASLKGTRVFISYASADRIFVDVLEKKLQADGVLCWRDDHSLVAGRVDKQLQRAITQNDVLIVVLSEASLASDWVRWELDQARTVEKTAKRDIICPVAVDRAWESWTGDPVLKREILKYHILHFTGWPSQDTFGEAYGRLVAGLRQNYLSSGPRI